LYTNILQDGTRSVFEFGCNRGKNLLKLQELGLTQVSGIDLSPIAVRLAQSVGLDVSAGDESSLREMPPSSVDCVFTCSVLCHIPARIEFILSDFFRIARRRVVLAETQEISDYAFYYSHDYPSFGLESAGSIFVGTTSMIYEIWTKEIEP